ncbi:flagellar associated protein [Coprinellus micaceus]|uniref:Flagellar associated protein n=1 Tax=Coprinellus micaceus TaxID=71717 RepID=A0A4Y7TQ03_COPMI|nr:flagellar associated protein [Coprinellus micaceus]
MATDTTNGDGTKLNLLHFNDVYRVTPQKISASSPETFDVSQFAWLVDDLRSKWPKREDGAPDGLLLFSGDVFSPSVESSVTRGSHMVPVLNELGIDVTVTGNHDFDFGYPHLTTLIGDTRFPWLLSNIIDENTGRVPEGLKEYFVVERAGVRIGVIGLVEADWIATVASWPAEFKYRSMADTAKDLSKVLRDHEGEHRVDIIIALTHSRIPNDITLAKDIFALSPTRQKEQPTESEHGADILFGGHDHLYFIAKGVDNWDGFDVTKPTLGAEADEGDILVVKSGSDFKDLSEIQLTLRDTAEGSVRKKVISEIRGIRHNTAGDTLKSQKMADLVAKLLSGVGSTLKAPVCNTTVMLDLRSYHIRTTESVAGNLFADIVRHAYDDSLFMSGHGGSDGVLICAGTLRGDSTYGPGLVTLGDILEILPFEDPLIVIEADGRTLWEALEGGLSKWPAQEGRFPVISGFKVTYDSRREPGDRVTGVWMIKEKEDTESVYLEPVKKEKGEVYTLVTREYMADGHDGFLPLKSCHRVIDEECGSLMSSIVRKYFLGSHFVNKMARIQADAKAFHPKTQAAIEYRLHEDDSRPRSLWKNAVNKIIQQQRSKAHYCNQLNASANQHMSAVDPFDGVRARQGELTTFLKCSGQDEDLLVVSPAIDGRFKDEGRGQ